MLDFTPHITLSPRDSRIYTVARICIYGLFIAACCRLLFAILFPTTFLTFDFTKPRALTNTIAQPSTENGTLTFDASSTGSFDTATLTLTFTDGTHITTAPRVTLRRGYAVQFLPITDDAPLSHTTETSADLSPGMLFERAGGVWVVTDTAHIAAIADAETLLAKGWSFDDVRRDIDSDAIAPFAKRKLFTMKDRHPDGTLLYATDTDAYTLVDSNVRRSIAHAVAQELSKKRPVITITETSQEQNVTCTPVQSALPWRKMRYTCTLPLNALSDLIGTDYHFSITGIDARTLHTISVALHKTPTVANARAALTLTKKRLLQNYTEN